MIQKKRVIALSMVMALVLSACGQGEAVENSGNSQVQSSVENSQTGGLQEGQGTVGQQPTEAPQSTPEATKSPEETEADKAAEELAKVQELYNNRPIALKQMEDLNRGFVAVQSEEGTFLSWRFLATDDLGLAFNVYKDGVLLNAEPIGDVTSYLVEGVTDAAKYTLVPVAAGVEKAEGTEEALFFGGEYLSVPVKQYEIGDYDINDASVGDLDGDGQYEIVVRREPADMDYLTRVAYPLIEAYELDGTHMWTINIGPNEINPIDINFVVYDMNGDGKAEVLMRSFEETTDGIGNQVGDVNGDGKTRYDGKVDKVVVMKDRSYLSKPPEFLSMYDGETGAEIARTELLPERDPLDSWYAASDYGKQVKRASHFLFCVAYLNGETPSLVHFRGAWATCKVAAYDIVDNQFELRFLVDCENKDALDNLYNTGYHSIAVADVDYDGKDEIITGAAAIDDDGSLMYTVQAAKEDGKVIKLGHGDAFDVAMMSPDTPQYYVWACRETAKLPVNIGLHNALTGEILFGETKPKDTGRSRAADIDPTSKGWEMWGSTGTPLTAFSGEILSADCPSSMNMKMYWDGDLLAELVDHDANKEMNILKWDWEKKQLDAILVAEGSASNGGSKGQTCLVADMLGDWREELIVRTADNAEMRIYSTTIATEYRIPTLMHDVTYREAVAWQNNHYNQPTNTSFYFGAEMTKVPVFEIYTIDTEGNRTTAKVYEGEPKEHAYMDISNGANITETEEKIVDTYAEQIALFAEQKDVWLQEDFGPYVASAAVYDLDRDGILELMTTVTQGTGLYSYNNFYHADVENGCIVELQQEPVELLGYGRLGLDLASYGYERRDNVYVDENGRIYYPAVDYGRAGISFSSRTEGVYYLENDVVTSLEIRSSTIDFTENEDGVESYYVPDKSEPVTKEEWEAEYEKFIEGKDYQEINIAWKDFKEEELSALSKEEWLEILTASWKQGLSGSDL